MKKLTVILIMFAIVSTSLFAQGLGFGLSVNQYYMEDDNGDLPTLSEAWDDFKEGNGRYWGGFGELMGRNYALWLSFNFMIDRADPAYWEDVMLYDDASAFDMWNYDVNLYLAYHFFGTKSILDPFVQAGFGVWVYDYMNKDALRDEGETWVTDDPLMGSAYFDLGAGLGINLGGFGVFFKAMYNFQLDEPLYGEEDQTIFELPVMPLKWTFGAKMLI